jgi:hypothetical protein
MTDSRSNPPPPLMSVRRRTMIGGLVATTAAIATAPHAQAESSHEAVTPSLRGIHGHHGKEDSEWPVVTVPFRLEDERSVTNVRLLWAERSDADRYVVRRDGRKVGTVTGGSFDDHGVPRHRTHRYTVEARADGRLVATTPATRFRPFTPHGTPTVWDNTKEGSSLDEPIGIEIDGIYYRYSTEDEGSGTDRTVTITEATSPDGRDFGQARVLKTYEDAKLEGVGSALNPTTGKVVFWAHYENGSDYSLAEIVIAEITPGGEYTETFKGRPLGNDSHDLGMFIEEEAAYFLSATKGNSDLAIYSLDERWNKPVVLINTIFVGQNRESPSILKHGDRYFCFSSKASGWYPSQATYAWADDLAGEWSDLRQIANTATFGSQCNGAESLGRTHDSLVLWGTHWGAQMDPPDAAGTFRVMMPLAIDGAYAAATYFPRIDYYGRAGIVPVQTGRNLSLGRHVNADKNASKVAPGAITNGSGASDSAMFHGGEEPYSVTVDLGAPMVLEEMRLTTRLYGGSETAYRLELTGSNDGDRFETILPEDKEDWTVGFLRKDLESAGPHRYVRLTVNDVLNVHNGNSAWWADGLYELTILGSEPRRRH